MKIKLLASFLLCPVAFSGALTQPAEAQISTNLDALPSAPANPSEKASSGTPHTHHAPVHRTQKAVTPSHEAAGKAKKEPSSPPGYTTIPAVPAKAPRNVVIAPPFIPVHKHPPVPPEDVKADPASKSTFTSSGEQEKRVLFDAQSSSLNQETLDSISALGKMLSAQPDKRIRLESYATGVDDDASLPRRVSLERAMVIRSQLILSGVATTRIYPIAHGKADPSDKNPPDRVDIHISANPVKIVPMSGIMTGTVPPAPPEGKPNTP